MIYHNQACTLFSSKPKGFFYNGRHMKMKNTLSETWDFIKYEQSAYRCIVH